MPAKIKLKQRGRVVKNHRDLGTSKHTSQPRSAAPATQRDDALFFVDTVPTKMLGGKPTRGASKRSRSAVAEPPTLRAVDAARQRVLGYEQTIAYEWALRGGLRAAVLPRHQPFFV
jgi:hypothetical protein